MRLKVGYVEAKREIYYEGSIVEVLKGKDMFSKIKKDSDKYRVDCQSSSLFSSDILNSSSCKEEFFFINPNKNKVITRLISYSDLWYNLNFGSIKKKTLSCVNKCFSVLEGSGFSNENLICFIKENDGFYHLVIDGVEYGYLDDSKDDLEFKNMLTCIFKDIKTQVDVVVMPSKGKDMLFSSTVGLYKRKSDFIESCISKGIISSNIGVENLVAATKV